MTLQDWGAIGEVVGALAQTCQVRSDALQAMLVQAADSESVGPIIIKLTELESVQAQLDAGRGKEGALFVQRTQLLDGLRVVPPLTSSSP